MLENRLYSGIEYPEPKHGTAQKVKVSITVSMNIYIDSGDDFDSKIDEALDELTASIDDPHNYYDIDANWEIIDTILYRG